MIWDVSFGVNYGSPIDLKFQNHLKATIFQTGGSRCKTGFHDFQDSVAVCWNVQRTAATFCITVP
jgi:hypothetical protein